MSNWGLGALSMGGQQQHQDAGQGAEAGQDLIEVVSDDINFQDVADAAGNRLRISQAWPEDNLPPVTASLLSIASQKGLFAAATPNGVVVASTEKARVQYLSKRNGNDGDKIRDFLPDVTLATPRVSHVAFSSDESCLVVAAEQNGGLSVFDTNSLSNGAQPVFAISTNQISVRHVLPNPNTSSDLAHFFGIVLSDGKLMLADLKKRTLVNKSNGDFVFHDNVSSAAWSKLGKQIVAGLVDSTAAQIDPQGVVKQIIPRPPQLQELQNDFEGAQALPITSIAWLSNYEFLLVFSPSYSSPDDMARHDSLYFIARRTKETPFAFHKVDIDPCVPFGMTSRTPANHFILRATDWVNVKDLLILASTASTDIGAFAHLVENHQKGIPDEMVTLTVETEGRKALLPRNPATDSDTSLVGMALDFSSKEVPPRPIPEDADLFSHSTIALPALYVLTQDGMLTMWWLVNKDAIRAKTLYPGMVHKNGRYAKYKKYNKVDLAVDDTANPFKDSEDQTVSDAETEHLGNSSPSKPQSTGFGSSSAATSASAFGGFSQPAKPQQPAFGQSSFGQNAGNTAFGGTSTLGAKPSPWGGPTPAIATSSTGHTFGQPSGMALPAASNQSGSTGVSAFGQSSLNKPTFGSASTPVVTSAFGQSSFGKPSTPATPAFGQPSTPATTAFGKPSTPATPAFGQPSAPAATPAFGQSSTLGKGLSFGQSSQPNTFGGFGKPSQLGGGTASPSAQSGAPFAAFANGKNQNQASPFASAGNGNQSNLFAAFAKQTPPLSQQTSNGSTATINSSGLGSFGSGSAFAGSSFVIPSISTESTMKDGDEPAKQDQSTQRGQGLFGVERGTFKLGSTFQGDGSAKDDLPKPANPGAGLFGAQFGNVLGESIEKAESYIQKGDNENKSPVKDVPFSAREVQKEPPLPPSFTKTKSQGIPDDAPLPPDPTTYKAPTLPDDLPLPPDFAKPGLKDNAAKEFPVAGSPPVDITNSRKFSPVENSEAEAPLMVDDEDWEEEDDEDDEGEGEEEEEDEEDEEEEVSVDVDQGDHEDYEEGVEDEEEDENDDDDDDEEDLPYVPKDPAALAAFKSKLGQDSPEIDTTTKSQRTPQSDEKTVHSSYTPAGLPNIPVFHPPGDKTQHSPRSPSPRRAVTSPVARSAIPQRLPSQIKTSTVPPAKPIENAPALPQPRGPTAGELEDDAAARLQAYLDAPSEPTRGMPSFYTHTDYDGGTDKPGIGGQIEKVYRDANSMIATLGLNAKGLANFVIGHEGSSLDEHAKKELNREDTWSLGDMRGLSGLLDDLEQQLEDGRLDHVRGKLEDLVQEQKEMLKLKAKKDELRKQIAFHTSSERLVAQETAPLSAESQAQQLELRQGAQRLQGLLAELEQKMTVLRADLGSVSQNGRTNSRTPVPTAEAVMNTITKMTAMVQEKSSDIDVLEAQIKRLPAGIASLRLADGYEDDLASRLAGNRLLSNSRPAQTPPRRPRMAANGDPLGMSGMFGTSRFHTPPPASASARRSVRFTPDASGFNRSGGSVGGSARKKRMSDVSEREIAEWSEKIERRRTVLAALQVRAKKSGARTVTAD